MLTRARLFAALSTFAFSLTLAPSFAQATDVEWASFTLGFKNDGKTHGAVCTDKKSENAASACSLKAFKDGGGVKLADAKAWNCKGYSAAAMASNGGTGVASCKTTLKEAESMALTLCIQAAEGHDDCKIVVKKSDLL